ncbi:MAG: HAMP domain-containing protein [Chloroflexi bacterium]|nr:HAMP domain-containing protein [Chloroflexota bacterium]
MSFVSGSLSRRIVASVGLGLALILLLFGAVGFWRISESVEGAYRGRVIIAEALSHRLDDVLRYYLTSLEREAADLGKAGDYRLGDLHQRLRGFTSIVLTDSSGVVLWTDPDDAEVAVGGIADQQSVQTVLSTGKQFVGERAVPEASGKILGCLAVPLHDRNGKLTGTLMAEFDPAYPPLNLLALGETGQGLQAQLVNVRGQLLDATDGLWPRRVAERSAAEHRTLLADLMDGRQSGYRIHEPTSSARFPSHVVAYAPSRVLPSWGLTVEQPADELLATSRNLLERQVLIGFAALLLAIGVSWIGVRRVVRPLMQLTSVAERFAAGKLDEPVDIKREDEIGILAHAFDAMRVRLRALLAEVAELNRDLELRVAARTAEVERRNRELAHLNVIATAVSASLNAQAMLESTLSHVLQMTGAEAGCFWIVRDGGAPMGLAVQQGWPSDSVSSCAANCLCRRAASSNQVLHASAEDLDSGTCGLADLRSAVAVPVPSGERVQAVLLIGSSRPDCFGQVAAATLMAVAHQIGVALEKALLYEEVQRKEELRGQLLEKVIVAQEEERKRVARDLHDQLAQELPALIMSLEEVKHSLPRSAGKAEAAIERAKTVANVTLGDVRKLIGDLRPSVLDDLGLVPAIRWYGERYLEERGVKFECHAIGFKKRLPPQLETALFRIVQEAINNASKHAQATSVKVRLEVRDTAVFGVVEDNGRGFDLAQIRRGVDGSEGLGLMGMQERVALFGGEFALDSQMGKGTRISIRVPLGTQEEKRE